MLENIIFKAEKARKYALEEKCFKFEGPLRGSVRAP